MHGFYPSASTNDFNRLRTSGGYTQGLMRFGTPGQTKLKADYSIGGLGRYWQSTKIIMSVCCSQIKS